MKYTVKPLKGNISGQRSGSATGQHVREQMVFMFCSRAPECSRRLYGGVSWRATLKGSLPAHSNNPAAILVFIMSLSVLSGHAKKHLPLQFYFFSDVEVFYFHFLCVITLPSNEIYSIKHTVWEPFILLGTCKCQQACHSDHSDVCTQQVEVNAELSFVQVVI